MNWGGAKLPTFRSEFWPSQNVGVPASGLPRSALNRGSEPARAQVPLGKRGVISRRPFGGRLVATERFYQCEWAQISAPRCAPEADITPALVPPTERGTFGARQSRPRYR